MANHKSSVKRARQTIKKTAVNKRKSSEAKTVVKQVRNLIVTKAQEEAKKLMPKAQSLLDRLAKKGIIKKNSAARKIARLAQKVAKI